MLRMEFEQRNIFSKNLKVNVVNDKPNSGHLFDKIQEDSKPMEYWRVCFAITNL